MWTLHLVSLSLLVLGTHSQQYPRLEHEGTIYANNSFINGQTVSQGNSALICRTNQAGCCDSSEDADWFDENGNQVYQGESGATALYVTRGTGRVNLNRSPGTDTAGVWRCQIPDSVGTMQNLYIYIGGTASGRLQSADVSFTELHTQPNTSPVEFTLSCLSLGGPATTVVWYVNGSTIPEDDDHVTSQIVVSTLANANYENRLRVRERRTGDYHCNVSSNRVDFFGPTGSSVVSPNFTVVAAGQPKDVHVVELSGTSVEVQWDPPGLATGYVIYYSAPGTSVMHEDVAGGDTDVRQLDNLQSDLEYMFSIVALSQHLPSELAGPFSLSNLDPPTVVVTGVATITTGSELTLTCTITIPHGISVTPTVEWEGPGSSGSASSVTESSSSTYMSRFTVNSVDLSTGGEYICLAQYESDGVTSPEETDSHSLSVTLGQPSFSVTLTDASAVPYIGGTISLRSSLGLIGVSNSEVTVTLIWRKDGEEFTGISDRVTISSLLDLTVVFLSTLEFDPLEMSDEGVYDCVATISPPEGSVPEIMATSNEFTLTITTPEITVDTTPVTERVLDIAPYNGFTLTCTASASVDSVNLPLSLSWQRRVGSSGSFQPVDPSLYDTDVSDDTSYMYTSVLTSSESVPQDSVFYRCTASFDAADLTESSTTTVTVAGEAQPLAPSRIDAVEERDSSVVIQWTIGSIIYTPEDYRVQYGTSSGNLNLTSAVESSGDDITIVDQTYTIDLMGLQPVTTYHYRIVVQNSFDEIFSPIETFTTLLSGPSPPQNFRVVEPSSGVTYVFHWEEPAELFNSSILDYTVVCRPTLEGVEDRQNTSTGLRTPISLGHGLAYNCSVVARNDVGRSSPVFLNSLFTTEEAAPTGAPTEFRITPGATSLMFQWQPPSPPERNGVVTGYTIQCSDYPNSLTADRRDTSLTADGFLPYTEYTCSISASNSEGTGPEASDSVTTLETAPDSAPTGLMHSVFDGTSDVQFTWDPIPASDANGNITHYTIDCTSESDSQSEETASGLVLETVLSSLIPGTDYSCVVFGSTLAGESPESDAISVLTVPGIPQDLALEDSIQPTGLLASWTPVSGQVVTDYIVEVFRVNREGNPFRLEASSESFTILSGLVGGYEVVSVTVSARNSAGYGPFSVAVEGRTPPIRPGVVTDPLFQRVSDSAVNISWGEPEFPNGILLRYHLTVKFYESGRETINMTLTKNNSTFFVVVESDTFEAGTPYNGSVMAVNVVGVGEKDPRVFFVGEAMPSAIEVMEMVVRTSTGFLITWQRPNPLQARGVITFYQIDFAESGSSEEVAGSSEGEKKKKRQTNCESKECVLAQGETRGCCKVPSNQTFANVSGLDPGKAYTVTVAAVNGAGVGERSAPVAVEAYTTDSEGGSSFPVAVVIVVVVVVVLILAILSVILVVAFLIYRKMGASRGKGKEGNEEKTKTYKPQTNDTSSTLDSKSPSRQGRQGVREEQEMVPLAAFNPTRSPEEMEHMQLISIEKFPGHVAKMHQDRDRGFENEYQFLSSDPVAPSDVARLPANKAKNRFANILPYDYNRVKLREIEGVEGSTYINASYIDGYDQKKAFIATQGPMLGTVSDFWRMIWEHRLETIVMLTKTKEGGKAKCESYWPEKVGDSLDAGGGIRVNYKQLLCFADYEIKKFHMTQFNQPPLEVLHFQFVGWPDHGVPSFATALIGFIRRVKQHHRNKATPLVVHCSAGVGRTGTYILLDSMLDRINDESTVNVYEFLCQMRNQKMFMVQTLAQYVFIHDALEEMITCGDTSISSANLRTKIGHMHKIIPNKSMAGFSDQFQLLLRVTKPNEREFSNALEPYNKDKNRYSDRVPFNKSRLFLKPTGVSGGDYINAGYLDGYKQRKAYIAAQAPLEKTVNDFWRMIWEFKSRTIVMLCPLVEEGKEMSYQYWPVQPNTPQTYGKNFVTLISEETMPDTNEVTIRKFEIGDNKNTTSFSLTQYHLNAWPEKGRITPSILIKLVDNLTKTQQNTGNRAITVVCNDGMGRTGTFICIHAMLERMKTEGVVDFFQFIKSSRISRPHMVSEQDHYILCHDTVADYLDIFDTYSNFKEV